MRVFKALRILAIPLSTSVWFGGCLYPTSEKTDPAAMDGMEPVAAAIDFPTGNINWTLKPGSATDIGVSSDNSVWIIGTEQVARNGDRSIKRWNGSGWTLAAGGGISIDVRRYGVPWVVNSYLDVYEGTASGNNWALRSGKATDLGIGGLYVWKLGLEQWPSGDRKIYKWDGRVWNLVAGGGVRLDVSPAGIPWLINAAGEIWEGDAAGMNWRIHPHLKAAEISLGGNDVWILRNVNPTPGGDMPIYRFDPVNYTWIQYPDVAKSISVGPDGKP